jgi:hypothetical protein
MSAPPLCSALTPNDSAGGKTFLESIGAKGWILVRIPTAQMQAVQEQFVSPACLQKERMF